MKKTVFNDNILYEKDIENDENKLFYLKPLIDKKAISSLSIEDQIKFIEYGIASSVPPKYKNILEAFECWVSKTPNTIAAIHIKKEITYKELDDEATILALILKQRGISSGDSIALYMHRSIDMLIGIIASLKLGAIYIPQDPRIVPEKMLQSIYKISNSSIIISNSNYQELNYFKEAAKIIFIDKELSKDTYRHLYGNVKLINQKGNTPNDTCFILFTSGTTGIPNGVQVTNKNLCNILYTSPGDLNIRPGTKVAQILNISFDMAAWEILGCLGNGGTLLIRGKSIQETAQKAHVIIATPTVLTTIDITKCKSLKTVAVAGEPCPEILANKWAKVCDFYNSCGPTETTIVNTMKRCGFKNKELSIGKPTPNNTVYILNDNREPCKIGEVGIMWAGGDCVTKGYVNNNTLNQKRYAVDPFLKKEKKMFNTGDLGRWNLEGELIHYGRIDDQVKIKGFRVELDAISKIIERIYNVKRAVTIKHKNSLVSFISGEFQNKTEILDQLKMDLSNELPYYYLPSEFIFMKELPKTSRGKINKSKLKEILS
ncbi:peptide synthetase [Tenacibaculum sp. Bg11-29]|uniref:AMP-binding protein n=1 Tax=Tenacibaculum sp. Bg11-29 TaxID=2058306 RepID=UPI000C34AD38|nr:AMP-binding protein [Tenacibaculum sp. Bg11-29]PKH51671.1 peptide synthetase [Tenacibaculum sp. Bg11-29]